MKELKAHIEHIRSKLQEMEDQIDSGMVGEDEGESEGSAPARSAARLASKLIEGSPEEESLESDEEEAAEQSRMKKNARSGKAMFGSEQGSY